jgi:peptidoglycan/LPS O-acetylase OafA/YrhL
LRRILRIWPLYFIALFLGLFLLAIIYPKVMGQAYLNTSVIVLASLYAFFLPNLASAFYRVGVLDPLWSIGIEEQFYLFWAPVLKHVKSRLCIVLMGAAIGTSLWYVFLNIYLQNRIESQIYHFLRSMKFHNMAIGSVFAYLLHFKRDAYRASFCGTYLGQGIVLGAIVYYFVAGDFGLPKPIVSIILSLLAGCCFINVSSLDKPLINLEVQPFAYLGEISYGLYIYHSFVEYGMRYCALRLANAGYHESFFCALLLLGGMVLVTIGLAGVSFRFVEKPFARLKKCYPHYSLQGVPKGP